MVVFAGRILGPDGVLEGYLDVEGGRVKDVGEGPPPTPPVATGWIVPGLVNGHTHIGDTFLRSRPKPKGLAELVGPGGWKHQQLAASTPDERQAGMRLAAEEMTAIGTAAFLDFREQGAAGVVEAREATKDIASGRFYGRGKRSGFDEDEAAELLAVVDGLGLSGLNDTTPQAAEAWAEAAHRARKPVALHVSELRRESMEDALALEPQFLVHAGAATPRDWQDAADAGVPVVVCPRSNAHFGLKTPIPAMLDAGLTLAIGTDNGMLASANLLDEMAFAQSIHGLPTETLLRLAVSARPLAGLPWRLPKRGDEADWIVLPETPWTKTDMRPGFAPRKSESMKE